MHKHIVSAFDVANQDKRLKSFPHSFSAETGRDHMDQLGTRL